MVAENEKAKTISIEDWEERLENTTFTKDEVNRLVLNYLVIEGYQEAAEKFQAESKLDYNVDSSLLEQRMLIRAAVQNGEIQKAIELVNDLNPEVLDTNPKLFFHLQQQKLIELIREGDITSTLNFACEELANSGEENPVFLEELEKTMTLLAFEDQENSPMGYLLDSTQRQKVASELNSAILASQAQEKDPKLPTLIKMLPWCQQQLSQKVSFPIITNILSAELHDPATCLSGIGEE